MKQQAALALLTLCLKSTALYAESLKSSQLDNKSTPPSVLKRLESLPEIPASRSESMTEALKQLEFHSLEKSQQTVTVESGWIGHPSRKNTPWLICQRISKVELSLSDSQLAGSTTPSQLQEVRSTRTVCKPLY